MVLRIKSQDLKLKEEIPLQPGVTEINRHRFGEQYCSKAKV